MLTRYAVSDAPVNGDGGWHPYVIEASRGARATVEAPVASSSKLGRASKVFPLQPATEPASQPYQPGSCLQRPHRVTVLVFVIVQSDELRHDPLTRPRICRRPSRACFCGRLFPTGNPCSIIWCSCRSCPLPNCQPQSQQQTVRTMTAPLKPRVRQTAQNTQYT